MMPQHNSNSLISQIHTLLEKEHKALVSGDLDTLVKLLDQKQALVTALNASPLPDVSTLRGLQTKAIRNQAMLESATRGIKSVSTRLATLQKVRKSLESYDASGKKKTILGSQKNTLEKRA
ncbi:MAG: hypothetical protein KIH71_001535 [Roseobacter sp.]|nr:hypothetical protein [Roseobacter sp.]